MSSASSITIEDATPQERDPQHLAQTSAETVQDVEKNDNTTSTVAAVVPETPIEKSVSVDTHRFDFGFLPIPPSCRYDPDHPPPFPFWKTGIFAAASTFSTSAMNLYYCQPLLVELANNFKVDEIVISRIPSLLQAGYAVGLVFISPLGDLVRRRQLLLVLMITAGALSIGLAITNSFVAFEVISFFVAIFSVTPQVLIPLTADLVPAQRRATSIAIVLSGLLMGVLLARVLSGIIAEFSSYKNVYWMGVAGQFLLISAIYFICPDTPVKNPDLSYFNILWTMAKYATTEPQLIQGCLIIFAGSAVFAGFWVTMTFLLSGAPYHYTTLDIGLFGLVGMLGVCTAPFVGRAIDGFVPWMATGVAIFLIIVSQAIETGAAKLSVGAVIVSTFVLDVGIQACQISVTTAVFAIAPEARARLNACVVLSIFLGQVMGTSVGTQLLVEHSYEVSSGVRLAFCGWQILILLLRGPHVPRKTWFGWKGGMQMRKKPEVVEEAPASGTVTPENKAQ
ncbi:major facilitator superfamily domain-containing protein [Crepidotus variabilis]|uniref:Major facilitator superfamily domain-containing protein n=1 Tax=Crepidotus variabilis TaxID=179855 RepID=A0A9P6E4E8_9AGAR|nr:major facilitator superfamily domain-containing protein [Crepidotus variabilis]